MKGISYEEGLELVSKIQRLVNLSSIPLKVGSYYYHQGNLSLEERVGRGARSFYVSLEVLPDVAYAPPEMLPEGREIILQLGDLTIPVYPLQDLSKGEGKTILVGNSTLEVRPPSKSPWVGKEERLSVTRSWIANFHLEKEWEI